jgi:uncharacterized protein YbjT (DUF2867 family)
MGITGNVGGAVARNLLAAVLPVRAIVRDPAKATDWSKRGAQLVQADIHNPQSLAGAFSDADGVFILVPPVFDPQPGFPEARSVAASLKAALEAARPGKVVYLSTIGAQASESNLLSQHTLIESELGSLSLPITFLRPGWFMENSAWDVAPARESGVIPSFLQPLDKPVPMVATEDIGRVAAELLTEIWTGHRVVELEGPQRVSPNLIAETFTALFGHPVSMKIVPRESWESLFQAQGVKNPQPRIRMLDGFNEGWIDFESGPSGTRKGIAPLETVLKKLIEASPKN